MTITPSTIARVPAGADASYEGERKRAIKKEGDHLRENERDKRETEIDPIEAAGAKQLASPQAGTFVAHQLAEAAASRCPDIGQCHGG